MIVWTRTPAVLSFLYARVLYFCIICTCSAQFFERVSHGKEL